MNEQAVTETEAEKPTGEGEGAQDLDTLLKDYEEKVETKQEPDDTENRLTDEDRNEIREFKKQRLEADINNAVETVRDNLETKLPDWIINGALQYLAIYDNRFQNAWTKRSENKGNWNRVLQGVAQKIANELPDFQSTETRNQVVAAVKGASVRKADSGEMGDLSKMSHQEFELMKLGLK